MAVIETGHLGNRCYVGYTFLSAENMDNHGLSMIQDTYTIACALINHSLCCFSLGCWHMHDLCCFSLGCWHMYDLFHSIIHQNYVFLQCGVRSTCT